MSYEIASESLSSIRPAQPRRVNGGAYRGGLGATGAFATLTRTLTTASPAIATAPWMQGLPGPGDSKDSTRIAYAKRDHDLAMPPRNDATAYANLKSQASGSATKVGKAWYNAALNDVNRARAATVAPPPSTVAPATPYAMPVLRVPPIVQQATDMGLKVQQTTDGNVVAVNGDGAVVSKPLPVPVSAVTDSNVIPANTVQANAPPSPHAPSSGIFSIFEKLTDAITGGTPSSSGGSSFVASQGPPMPLVPDSAVAPIPGTQPTTPNLFSNPIVLLGGAAILFLLFSSSHGGRR